MKEVCWITIQVERGFKQEVGDEISRTYPKWSSVSQFARAAMRELLRREKQKQ